MILRNPSLRFLLVLGTMATLGAARAQAASSQADPSAPSFAVGPMKVDVQGRPGSTGRGSFTLVTSNAEVPTRFLIEVEDLGQVRGGRTVPLQAGGSAARSCRPWLRVEPEVTVPPNGRTVVPVELDFPRDASGEYFALVTVRLQSEASLEPVVVAVNPAVSVMVEASVPGPAPAHVDVTAVELPPSGAAGQAVQVTLSNRGVWKSTVEGDLLLYPDTGGFPIRAELPRRRGAQPLKAFPGLSFPVLVPLPRPLPAGSYRVVGRLLLNGRWRTENEFQLEVVKGGTARVRHLADSEFDIRLQTQPDLIELPVPPGATRTIALRIASPDPRPLDLTIEVAEMRMENSGLITFPGSKQDEAHWVSVSPDKLRLLPRRTATVRTAISVPRELPSGTMVLRAVRIRARAEAAEPGWKSAGEAVVPVVAVDPRAPAASLALDPIKLVRPADDRNPTAALVRVRNVGGRVARLQGDLRLLHMSGELAARQPIGTEGPEILLPGGMRELRLQIPTVDEGNYLVQARLKPSNETRPVTAEVPFESVAGLPLGLEPAEDEKEEEPR